MKGINKKNNSVGKRPKKVTQKKTGCDTDKWRLCKTLFSYGESLQQYTDTLGDLEPVHQLFTITSEITLPQAVTRVAYARKRTVRRKQPNEMLKRTKPLRSKT